jgi:hypothetical protein
MSGLKVAPYVLRAVPGLFAATLFAATLFAATRFTLAVFTLTVDGRMVVWSSGV